MHNPKSSLWWRDSNQTASGETGAVQCAAVPEVREGRPNPCNTRLQRGQQMAQEGFRGDDMPLPQTHDEGPPEGC